MLFGSDVAAVVHRGSHNYPITTAVSKKDASSDLLDIHNMFMKRGLFEMDLRKGLA